MAQPIFIQSMLKEPRAAAAACRVWITPQKPKGDKASDRNVWMSELAPEEEVLKLLKARKMAWAEFEAYYLARLNSPAAQDDIRALACLSQDNALMLLCGCADCTECYLPVLVRVIQEYRDRKDFKLSLGDFGDRPPRPC